MDQDSSKNQNPQAILNQTKNVLFALLAVAIFSIIEIATRIDLESAFVMQVICLGPTPTLLTAGGQNKCEEDFYARTGFRELCFILLHL